MGFSVGGLPILCTTPNWRTRPEPLQVSFLSLLQAFLAAVTLLGHTRSLPCITLFGGCIAVIIQIL